MPGRDESTEEKQVPLLSIMNAVPKCEDNGCCTKAPNIASCPCRKVLIYHTQSFFDEITSTVVLTNLKEGLDC